MAFGTIETEKEIERGGTREIGGLLDEGHDRLTSGIDDAPGPILHRIGHHGDGWLHPFQPKRRREKRMVSPHREISAVQVSFDNWLSIRYQLFAVV